MQSPLPHVQGLLETFKPPAGHILVQCNAARDGNQTEWQEKKGGKIEKSDTVSPSNVLAPVTCVWAIEKGGTRF